jgi:hypothetical protein
MYYYRPYVILGAAGAGLRGTAVLARAPAVRRLPLYTQLYAHVVSYTKGANVRMQRTRSYALCDAAPTACAAWWDGDGGSNIALCAGGRYACEP